jgi:hypothetical protein
LLKTDVFDVRNSPLDRFSTVIGKLIACSKGACDFGGAGLACLAGLYTIDNIMKDIGLEPIFLPYLKSLTNPSNSEEDPSVVSDRNNKILIENLKELHNRVKEVRGEEEVMRSMFKDNFINKDDWGDLLTDFKQRVSVIEGKKESLLEQIKANMDKGYGVFDGTKNITFVERDSNSKGVLEALKDSDMLSEGTFTSDAERISKNICIPEDIQPKVKSLDIDYSNDKDSIDRLKSITESDNDSLVLSKTKDVSDAGVNKK